MPVIFSCRYRSLRQGRDIVCSNRFDSDEYSHAHQCQDNLFVSVESLYFDFESLLL